MSIFAFFYSQIQNDNPFFQNMNFSVRTCILFCRTMFACYFEARNEKQNLKLNNALDVDVIQESLLTEKEDNGGRFFNAKTGQKMAMLQLKRGIYF